MQWTVAMSRHYSCSGTCLHKELVQLTAGGHAYDGKKFACPLGALAAWWVRVGAGGKDAADRAGWLEAKEKKCCARRSDMLPEIAKARSDCYILVESMIATSTKYISLREAEKGYTFTLGSTFLSYHNCACAICDMMKKIALPDSMI